MRILRLNDQLEISYKTISGDVNKPCLLFLHEGLGSIGMWKDFPDRLCELTGCPGLLYDRSGYGRSSNMAKRWTIHYMHEYALNELPIVISQLIPNMPFILIGHSDGGSMDACMPGCVVKCSLVYHAPDKTHLTSSFEYEATAMVGTNLGITDPDIVARYDRICDEIGIDVIECGAALGVAADAGKIKMGDPDGVFGLLKEIEDGTDFGNILADGVVSTCKALGVDRIPAVKGQAIPAHDPRVGKATGVTYLTSPMGADHTAGLSYSGDFMANEGAVEDSLVEQIFCAARDALGYCRFASPDDKVKTMGFLTDLVNACYGLNLAPEDLITVGRNTLKDEIRFNENCRFHTGNEPDPEFIRNEPVAPMGLVFGVDISDMDKIWDKLDDITVL